MAAPKAPNVAGMTRPWWKDAVVYHIYVRSFQDTDDDGVGDIPGILRRFHALRDLGVNAVWLSPCYPSPQADFGYDVANYRSVDPAYGTLSDLEKLRDALHEEGMKLIMDFVPNHTSDQHAWFVGACQSRDAPTRDYYIWSDGDADGNPPNNWVSIFGGSAWAWHGPTGQYYLHSFLTQQPDLNWRNPQVVEEMHDVLRFWLAWGVDGFRVDAIPHAVKDADLRDNPPDEDYPLCSGDSGFNPYHAQKHVHDFMRPEIYDVVRGLRAVCDEFNDDGFNEKVLIGETAVPLETLTTFIGDGSELFHMAFYFEPLMARSVHDVRDAFERLYAQIHKDAWPALVLSNHDVDRHVSRLSPDWGPDDPVARLAAAANLLSQGTPFVYYGEELGLANAPIPEDALRDPVGLFELRQGQRLLFSNGAPGLGRDPERVPYPWDGSAHAGFTGGTPWLPMPNFTDRNYELQRADPHSLWHWYRRLIALRKEHPALHRGSYQRLDAPADIWAFRRDAGAQPILVVLNPSLAPHTWEGAPSGEVLLSSAGHVGVASPTHLEPREVLVLRPR